MQLQFEEANILSFCVLKNRHDATFSWRSSRAEADLRHLAAVTQRERFSIRSLGNQCEMRVIVVLFSFSFIGDLLVFTVKQPSSESRESFTFACDSLYSKRSFCA